MSKSFKVMLQAGLFSAVIVAAGCASNPEVAPISTVVSSAKTTLLDAQQSDLMRYAALDMRIAQEKVDAAQEALRVMDYVKADRLANEALVMLQLAKAKAQKEQAKTSAENLQQTLNVLQRETGK